MPDDLNMGYSHFLYGSVESKKMPCSWAGPGTSLSFLMNYSGDQRKDAYEATVAITAAFAGKPNCMFVVSTHIIEAGETWQRGLR